MLYATTVTTAKELEQILDLQYRNLAKNIDNAELQSQGFVTMHHSMEVLQQMHELSPSVIIKDDDKVVAYALVMVRECRQIFLPLEPMFAVFDQLIWKNKPFNEYSFYTIGQICVGKEYRGKGLFEMLYQKHKELFQSTYDFVATEISTRNHRSLRAHEKVGFKTIHTYRDELDEWAVVIWDWKD